MVTFPSTGARVPNTGAVQLHTYFCSATDVAGRQTNTTTASFTIVGPPPPSAQEGICNEWLVPSGCANPIVVASVKFSKAVLFNWVVLKLLSMNNRMSVSPMSSVAGQEKESLER